MKYNYWLYYGGIGLFCILLELILPRVRKRYSFPEYLQDFLIAGFNIYLVVKAYSWLFGFVKASTFGVTLKKLSLVDHIPGADNLILQFFIVLLFRDFIEYWVHRALHSFSWLWRYHKLHHSIKGMYWLANLRFHWLEIFVYGAVKYLPFLVMGFHWKATFWVGIFSMLIGSLNHANIKWDWGPLRYIFNSPSIHIYHHDVINHYRNGQNFGVVLSLWDWLFGTIVYPRGEYPAEIGFKGDEPYRGWFIRKMGL